MKTAATVLGIINAILIVVALFIIFSFYPMIMSDNTGWAGLILMVFAAIFLASALFEGIVLLVFLFKLEFNKMKLFFFTYLGYLAACIAMIVLASQ